MGHHVGQGVVAPVVQVFRRALLVEQGVAIIAGDRQDRRHQAAPQQRPPRLKAGQPFRTAAHARPPVSGLRAGAALALQCLGAQLPSLGGQPLQRDRLHSGVAQPFADGSPRPAGQCRHGVRPVFVDGVIAVGSVWRGEGGGEAQADCQVAQQELRQLAPARLDHPVVGKGLVDMRPLVEPVAAGGADHAVALAPEPFSHRVRVQGSSPLQQGNELLHSQQAYGLDNRICTMRSAA